MKPKEKKKEEKIEGIPPSQYLAKYFGIVLPSNIADSWDRMAYVEEDGTIVFEEPAQEIVSVYWEFRFEPFFDRELKKYLSWFLFDNNPDLHISVCEPGTVCEVTRDNSGFFEFRVYDSTGNRTLFSGAVGGTARGKLVDGRVYVEFVPSYIVIKPYSY